jgi:hypothetical protein
MFSQQVLDRLYMDSRIPIDAPFFASNRSDSTGFRLQETSLAGPLVLETMLVPVGPNAKITTLLAVSSADYA